MKSVSNIVHQNTELLIAEQFDAMLDPLNYKEMISELAYYKAEQRGFEPGHELEDWLEAEREITENTASYTPSQSKES